MPNNEAAPFESVEEAQEYLLLLAEAVLECRQEVDGDIQRSTRDAQTRRTEAFQVVAYKLDKLHGNLKNSLRLLNDLRTLRRLLLEERSQQKAPVKRTSKTIENELSYGT